MCSISPEDSQVFAQVLELSATEESNAAAAPAAVNVPRLLAAYDERRREDALAAVELSEEALGGGARSVGLVFAATMLVTMALHKTLGRLAPQVRVIGSAAGATMLLFGGNTNGGEGQKSVPWWSVSVSLRSTGPTSFVQHCF